MTQPLCAYEGCGKTEGHYYHQHFSMCPTTLQNHRFQPESTVEPAPELDTRSSIHRPGCPRYSGVGECDCFDDIPASTSPQGAGELHCQECREVITFNGSYNQWFHADGTSTYPRCTRPKAGAQGAVPGPQVENIARVMHNAMHVDAGTEYADWDKDASESTRELFIAAAIAVISFLATSEPHSPPITSGYVQEVRPDETEGPSCHVCGAIMVRRGVIMNRKFMPTDYACQNCGATTGCTPAEGPRPMICQACCTNVCSHNRCPNCHMPCEKCAEPATASTDERLAQDSAKSAPLVGHGVAGKDGSDDLREAIAENFLGGTSSDETKAAGTNLPTVFKDSPDERLAEIAERESKAGAGPWWPGCFVEEGATCKCRYILSEGQAGAIAEIGLDNGLSIEEGGNDGPPLDEAIANCLFIAHARADIPYLLRLVAELRQEREHFRRSLALLIDNCTRSDSYCVPGSEFSVCVICEGGSAPGKPGFVHRGNCILADGKLKAAVEDTWEIVTELESELKQLTARAEQAERERDEARECLLGAQQSSINNRVDSGKWEAVARSVYAQYQNEQNCRVANQDSARRLESELASRFCNCPNQADEDGSCCPICGKEKGSGCTPAEEPRREEK